MALTGRWFLNGADLYATYGIMTRKGNAGFQTPFEPKERLTHNWPEEDGEDVDTGPVKFNAKEVALELSIHIPGNVAAPLADYHAKRDAFIAALAAPGWHDWTVTDHDKTYSVIFKEAKGGDIESRSFSGRAFILFTFDLVLLQQPVNMPAQNWNVTILLNGNPHAIVPPGTTYNVITTGGGVTPSVNISSATVNGNTVTINATGTAGYAIQYGYQSSFGVFNWQSSNVFQNVPNGIYTFKARLVGTNIEDMENVNVNYTPPAVGESVKIDNVTVYQDRITVLATPANTTKAVEYSRNGTTWQASNVFNGVPNGSYTITARLVGTTITDVWGSTVTVNHTVTVGSFNTVLAHRERSNGVTFYCPSPYTSRFHFNVPLPSGDPFPASMTMYLSGVSQSVGRIDFNAPAIGQQAAIEVNGVLYPVTFRSNENYIIN